eukprot:TRINITY_DN11789_c0_g1_i1.p1 TRINITY_DN11789_c0_g1~~TRINITY_DN11789_c0_g1_i1.p1  ORF type:complete len:640 (-),score=83.74 TRINITY_DN11789_c0_g1_i1:224-2143(-)
MSRAIDDFCRVPLSFATTRHALGFVSFLHLAYGIGRTSIVSQINNMPGVVRATDIRSEDSDFEDRSMSGTNSMMHVKLLSSAAVDPVRSHGKRRHGTHAGGLHPKSAIGQNGHTGGTHQPNSMEVSGSGEVGEQTASMPLRIGAAFVGEGKVNQTSAWATSLVALRFSAWSMVRALRQFSPFDLCMVQDHGQTLLAGHIYTRTPGAKVLRKGSANDWASLMIAFALFVVCDRFFQKIVQHRTIGKANIGVDVIQGAVDPSVVMLRSIFDRCDVKEKGAVSRRDLINGCMQCSDISNFFCLKVAADEAATEEVSIVDAALSSYGPSMDAKLDWNNFCASSVIVRSQRFRQAKEVARGRDGDAPIYVMMLAFWIFTGVVYNALVFVTRGEEAALVWGSGYVLEWLLSIDDLFVCHLIFRVFRTPRSMLHFPLFVSIVGGMFFRFMLFFFIGFLVSGCSLLRMFFGGLLIYSGIRVVWEPEESQEDIQNSLVMRAISLFLGDRLVEDYDAFGRLFAIRGGRWVATRMFPVLLILLVTNAVFSVDAVSAKIAQISDPYTAVSSSVVAMFGLRSMFHLIEHLVEAFELLKHGLCFVLVFMGFELVVADYIEVPASAVFVVSGFVLVLCVGGSWLKRAVAVIAKS